VLIQRHPKGENVGYPTLCKGTFRAGGNTYHAIEDPTSLNAMELLPQLAAAGVKALKIEGRQRSPVYVAQVTRVWRQALDAFARPPMASARARNGPPSWARSPRAPRPPSVPIIGPGNERETITGEQS
jgi:collagenase-like PrtC family protease